MPDEVKEVQIDGKVIKLGMEYEEPRELLGTPYRTEPCLFGKTPAIRVIYHRGGNYYFLYFVKGAGNKVTLSFINIDGGY
jgi:hypothetical protein